MGFSMGTIALSGAVLVKAGKNVSSDLTSGWTPTSEYESWITEAEAYLSNLVKYDIVTNWANLNAVYKLMFTEYVTRYAANEAIKYDMSGYTSRIEAENLVNINIFRMNTIHKLLENASTQDFMGV